MPSKEPLLSDLVRDSKIETEALGSYIRHVFHEAGRSAHERRVRREERWVRQRYLGQGTYGTVYLEKSEDGGDEKLRAVKEVKKFVVLGQELDYGRELEAIMKFSHPKYEHCFVSSKGWYELEDSVFITMEFLELGDLQRYLTHPLPEPEGQQITEQILEGLGFMHDNGFIHRDLKPANVMVVTKGPRWFVKIADFGISKRRQQDVTTMLTLQRGTLGFAAPEALGAVPDSSYTFSVDMWSLGAVAYRILTNTTPFPGISELFRYAHGMLGFPTAEMKTCGVSEEGQAFIVNLMQPNPDARLSAASAANHPWMTIHFPDTTSCTEESRFSEATSPEPANNTGVSVASKAWSSKSTMVVFAESTARPVSRSNYQPPSVSDCMDEVESHGSPILPADSRVLLEEAIVDAANQHLVVNASMSAQERAERNELTEQVNQRNPSVSNQIEDLVGQDLTKDSDRENGLCDAGTTLTRCGFAVEDAPEPPVEEDEDFWNTISGKQKKKQKKVLGYVGNRKNTVQEGEKEQMTQRYMSRERLRQGKEEPVPSRQSPDAYLKESYPRSSSSPKESHDNGEEDSDSDHNIDNWNNIKVLEAFSVATDRKNAVKPENGNIRARCRNCGSSELYPDGSIEYLPCRHFMCHACLFQLLALSLISPKYLLPRCCNSADGEISGKSWGRLIVDPRINIAWNRFRTLKRLDNWTCPRGHTAQHGSLLVTTGPTPVWNQVVNCYGCLTERIASDRHTSFCLLCSAQTDSNECNNCMLDSVVWRFVLRLQERVVVQGWIANRLDEAVQARSDMRSGKALDYQTLRDMDRSKSPTMTDPDSTYSASETLDKDRLIQYGPSPAYPSRDPRLPQAAERVKYARARPYNYDDVEYSAYQPSYQQAPFVYGSTEQPTYRTVTCGWCSREHRKKMDFNSDVLGPYAKCSKCGTILICQECRRPISEGSLCECSILPENRETSRPHHKVQHADHFFSYDDDDFQSDLENQRIEISPSRGGNKIQEADGGHTHFRVGPGGRTERVANTSIVTTVIDEESSNESEDTRSDLENLRTVNLSNRRWFGLRSSGYAQEDSRDTLAHFGGETNPGAKLRGMRLRDIENWRRSSS